MKFGKYAVLDNAIHKFEKEPAWEWRFKPTTTVDEIHLTRYVEENSRDIEIAGKTIHVPPEWPIIAWRELAISFAGTNIPVDPDDPNSEPILKPNASIDEVEKVLKDMPFEMLWELWVALGEANPFMGPRKTEDQNKENQGANKASKKS